MTPTPKGTPVWKRRHSEWEANVRRWRFLLDSWEGGDQYRYAVYGIDRRGMPMRNLVRHKHEYPLPAESVEESVLYLDAATSPTDDDYTLRLARTPVPSFVAETIDKHLNRVFAREVDRDGPAALVAWWRDVDGAGTPIDDWMRKTVGPLLHLHGQVDVAFDHPAAPADAAVASQADAIRLGLTRCVARAILPDDVTWWRIDPQTRRYLEVVVRERAPADADDGDEMGGNGPAAAPVQIPVVPQPPAALGSPVRYRYRHWTAEGSTLYDESGRVLETRPHPFGRVPIVRIIDRPRLRCEAVGQSRLDMVAEAQREFYNRDSELILSDTLQAFPLLQGPEDYVQADGTVPLGPSWLLPKKKTATGASVHYEPFQVLDFPKGGAESIRVNKEDIRQAVERRQCLAKPAGASVHGGGGGGQVIAQSGLSKSFDHRDMADLLADVAAMLQAAEATVAEFALVVLADGAAPDMAAVSVAYPKLFEVRDAADLADQMVRFQLALGQAGKCPEAETPLLQALMRANLPGRKDEEYDAWDDAIAGAVAAAADRLAAGQAAAAAAETTTTVGVRGESTAPEGGPMKLIDATQTVTKE